MLGIKLIVEGLRVVIVDEHETFACTKGSVVFENELMTASRNLAANVQLLILSHDFSLVNYSGRCFEALGEWFCAAFTSSGKRER